MIKNLRRLVLALLATVLTGAIGVGAATLNVSANDSVETVEALKGYNVTLKDDIALKYHFIVPTGYTAGEMTFTVGEGGSTVTVEQSGLTAGSEAVFVLNDLAPDDMTKKITAQVVWTDKNGKTGVEQITAHSVQGYLETLLKNALKGNISEIYTQEQYDALKSLVSSTLTYGDAAQTYVGAAANSAANLTVSEKNAAVRATATTSDLGFEGTAADGLAWTGATLAFGDKIDVVYYFKTTAAFAENKTLGAVIEGEFVLAKVSDKINETYTEYSVTYEGLSVTDFDKVLSATVAYKTAEDATAVKVGKTVKYSVKSYVNRINANATASENMKSLASAAYSYGVAVQTYVDAVEKDYNGEKASVSATTDTSTFENYLRDVFTYGLTPKFDVSYKNKATMISGLGAGLGLIHTGTTDGKYMYLMSCSGGEAEKLENGKYSRQYAIIKYDPATDKVIGRSDMFGARTGNGQWSSDDYLICYYNDGYIYAYDKDDRLLSAPVDGFNSTTNVALTAVENAPALSLDNVSGVAYKDGYYATINTSNVLSIYAENDTTNAVYTVSVGSNVGASSKRRLASCGDYLYVLRLGDGVLTPYVSVINWKAEILYNFTVPVTKDLIGLPETVEVTETNKETNVTTTKTVTTSSFNIQNFVVIDGTAYSFGYVWQTNYGRTPLFTINVKEQSLFGEYHTYSLAERGAAAKADKGITVETTTTLEKIYSNDLSGNNFVYASATDGKYAYFVGGNKADSAYIARYDLATNKKIAMSASIGEISEGNVYAIVKDGFVYVYSKAQGKVFRLPVGFNNEAKAVETELTFRGLSGDISGAYYSRKRKEYAVLVGNTVHVYGENLVEKNSFAVTANLSVKNYSGTNVTSTNKFLSGEDDYVYVCYYAQGSVTPGVVAYTFDGEEVYTGVIENNVHNKTDGSHKFESMISVDGALYFTILSWTTNESGTALFKTTFNSVKSRENIVVSIGEYYEKSEKIAFAETTREKLTDSSITTSYAHGFATDGTYGYMSVSVTNNGNKEANVVKFDLKTNKVVGFVKAPLNADVYVYNFIHNLFVYGNDVYLTVREDKAVYKIAMDEFDTTGKEMTEVKGFFGGDVTYADAAYYDEKNDRFAVRVGSDLYVGKKDALKRVSSTMAGKLAGIYADADYIYVLAESDNGVTCSLKVEIYDWNGNKITAKVNEDFKPMNGATSNNIQGLFAVNGKYYVLVCQWGNGEDAEGAAITAGAYIVSGNLDYSAL